MAESWSTRIQAMREELGISQQEFAYLLGFALRTVTTWERGQGKPRGHNAAVLELFASAMRVHAPDALIPTLRKAWGDPVKIMRALCWLERHPSIPLPPPPRQTKPSSRVRRSASSPPPSRARRSVSPPPPSRARPPLVVPSSSQGRRSWVPPASARFPGPAGPPSSRR